MAVETGRVLLSITSHFMVHCVISVLYSYNMFLHSLVLMYVSIAYNFMAL